MKHIKGQSIGFFDFTNHYGVYICLILPFLFIQTMHFIKVRKFSLAFIQVILLVFVIFGLFSYRAREDHL